MTLRDATDWPFYPRGNLDQPTGVCMFQKLIIGAALASVAVFAYATLTHVGFVYSIYFKLAPLLLWPMKSYAHVEHVIAFAILGALFAFAYPKRIIFVCCVVFSSAVILECLQTLTPDRHGRLIDAFEKVAGGALGILATRVILGFARSSRWFQN